jgi:proteasome lid subunit RPN8/RPN11
MQQNLIMNNELSLPRTLVNQMLAHAQQNPEQEICGLISQAANQNKRYIRIDNRASDTSRRFTMDEKQLVDTMRELREHGEQLLAIVHSHPHGAAQASKLDVEQAQYPDAYYLIISLNTRGVLEMRAFRISDGSASEVKVTI